MLNKSTKETDTFTAQLAYLLMLFGCASLGILSVASVILAHIKRKEAIAAGDTFLADHFRYIQRTFWFGLGFACINTMLAPFGIGVITGAMTIIWVVYRSIYGLLRLHDDKPAYEKAAA
ncbi:DUF4870 family protein [Veronia pacifica]|uniref:Transmembrane protein n=1 Tax=Veronia pacifica TaxID=1080227 RepID=A0A1C3EA67_9GAMM|nr:hypothetical protein [Veronia pacifica]ODA30136.1 hypothetical protein A8L45_21075 [Veronia pacifica]